MTRNSTFRSPSRTRRTILAMLAAAALAATPQTAHAQLFGSGIVFDPTNFARNVLHYARRLEQMNLQRQQLEQQLTAMRKLARPNWREIDGTLAQADDLLRAGQSLAYTLRGVDAEFRRTFPGAQVYADYPDERRAQSVRTLATLRAALNAANRAAQDLPAGVARLRAMKGQLATIRGHEEALELNGTIGVYGAEELTMLRQAVAALTNVETVYYADQVNTAAQRNATVRAKLVAMSAPGQQYPPVTLRVEP